MTDSKHMLKSIVRLGSLALIAGMLTTGYAAESADSGKKETTKEASAKDKKPKIAKVRHVVALKFKETATAEQIQKVEKAFSGLKAKIPQIVTLDFGTNVSPEKLNKGFTHCFLLSFKTEKDRDAYLVHPDHKAFADVLTPVLGDVFVIDYVATKEK